MVSIHGKWAFSRSYWSSCSFGAMDSGTVPSMYKIPYVSLWRPWGNKIFFGNVTVCLSEHSLRNGSAVVELTMIYCKEFLYVVWARTSNLTSQIQNLTILKMWCITLQKINLSRFGACYCFVSSPCFVDFSKYGVSNSLYLIPLLRSWRWQE